MEYLDSRAYCQDVKTAVEHIVGFDAFCGKRILILGASGLIGAFITDCFLYANQNLNSKTELWAVCRNGRHLKERFGSEDGSGLNYMEADVGTMHIEMPFDYIIHAASYGHPKAFREMPAEVLLSNVTGTQRALEAAGRKEGCRMLFVSSGEVQEKVDHLSARACYPIGKKAAETLCISYMEEYGTDVVIARPCHTFGANASASDNRAATQFIASAAEGNDIEMYSAGEQIRSFSYVADCASGLLSVLARGKRGAVYGISADGCCSVRAFAEQCAAAGGCRVRVHAADNAEKLEASPIARQIVSNDELKALGWQPAFSIDEGIARSIKIRKEMNGMREI